MHGLLIHLLQLAYLMAPAYCANMAPPFIRFWHGWNRPISERWFGSHKTVAGFLLGVIAGLLATLAQCWIVAPWLPADNHIDAPQCVVLGICFGFGAMSGDALKSLIKRRLHIRPGARWLPFDQIDFVLGALLFVSPWLSLGFGDVGAILAMTFIGDIAVNRLSFLCGIKASPW